MPEVQQPVTDDSIRVRQVSHYQFSHVPGEPRQNGTCTLQLVLDEGASEEVLTMTADDADATQDLLIANRTVFYDVKWRTLIFGTSRPGALPAG